MVDILFQPSYAGEEFPSEGTAFIFGKDIRSDPKAARQHVCLFFFSHNLSPTYTCLQIEC